MNIKVEHSIVPMNHQLFKLVKEQLKPLVLSCFLIGLFSFLMQVSAFSWFNVGRYCLLSGIFMYVVLTSFDLSRREISWKSILISLAAGPLYVMLLNYSKLPEELGYVWLTYLLILLTELIFFFLISRPLTAIILNTTLYALLLLTNDIVMELRQNVFMPSDILSFQTAASVSGSYLKNLYLSFTGSLILLSLGAIYITAFKLRHLCIAKRGLGHVIKIKCLSLAALILILLIIPVITPGGYEPGQFYTSRKVTANGYISTFYMELRGLVTTPPKGYDKALAEKQLKDPVSPSSLSQQDLPNIIVIMNEAFSDFSMLGDLPVNKDYMPFIHSLTKNTEKGAVYSSVWAGNTCNTEWEFLTGNTMAFYPGSIPYTEYISGKKFSLAAYLKTLGYETYAIHPYYGSGYRRDIVYPDLGFEQFLSLADFKNTSDSDFIRHFISDQTSFEKVIETYEKARSQGKPAFIFNVTMQNHAPYNTPDYIGKISLKLYSPYYAHVQQYLSLVYESDAAFEKLIDYFSKQDERTVILMFGDHQPGMNDCLYNRLFNHPADYDSYTLKEQEEKHIVPYILWKNYEDQTAPSSFQDVSSNYLALMLLKKANLPLNSWYTFLDKVHDKYPMINSVGIMDNSGQLYPLQSSLINDSGLLSEYRKLQYYRMFDESFH